MVKRSTHNRMSLGSIPSGPTKPACISVGYSIRFLLQGSAVRICQGGLYK